MELLIASRRLSLEGDARLTSLLAAFAFLAVGIPCVFTSTAAHTIFLQAIGPSAMPYVYIAEALLIPVVGSIFLFAESRIPLRSLALIELGTDFLVLVGLAVGLRLGVPHLELPAIVWFESEAVLNGLVLWGLAGSLMTLRQGKRLFGIIAAGEPAAIVAGGLMTPLLLRWLSAGDLFLVSAAGVAAGAGLVLYITSPAAPPDAHAAASGDDDAAADEDTSAAAKRKPWWLDRYILAMVAMAVVSQLGYFAIDNAFYIEAGQRHPEERDLAAFLGVFQGLIGVASVAVSLAVSGPFLRRFGAGAGLLALPALVLVVSLVTVGADLVSGTGLMVGWLVFGNKLIDMTFRYTLDRTCVIILYQPLSAELRLRAQAAMETIVEPLAAGLAGALLLLLVSRLGLSPVALTGVVIIVIVLWVALAILLHRGYLTALHGAMASRRLDGGTSLFDDSEALAHLRRGLTSPSHGEALYCLKLLAESEEGIAAEDLAPLLRHPESAIRLEAVRCVAQGGHEAHPDLLALIRDEPEPVVQGALLTAHAAVSNGDIVPELTPFLAAAEEDLRLAAFAGLLSHGGIAGMLVAGKQLLKALASPSAKERRMGARVLGEVGVANVWRHLLPLLDDADPSVRLAALKAAGQIKATACIPALLRNFEAEGFEHVSAASLVAIGTASIGPLARLFERTGCPGRIRRHVVTTLSHFGAAAIPTLLPMLAGAGSALRITILKALQRCRYVCPASERDWFEQHLIEEIRSAALVLAISRDCIETEAGGATQMLRRCCEEEIGRVEESIFLLLAVTFPRFDAIGAWANFTRGVAAQRAYALEAIDTLVSGDTRQMIVALLESDTIARKAIRSARVAMPPPLSRRERLADCALQPETRLLSSTRAYAVLALREARQLPAEVVARLGHDPDGLIRETVQRSSPPATVTECPPMMLTIEKVMVLRSVSIFSSIATEHLIELARSATPVELKSGETLITEGDHGTAMFVIVNGRVKVHRGDRTLAELGASEVVGEMAALDPGPRSASVTAVEDTLVLRIGNKDLEYLLADDANISRGIIKVLCQRLRQ